MEGKLLWFLDDDMLSGSVPADHVLVLWPLEEGVEFCEEGGLRFGLILGLELLGGSRHGRGRGGVLLGVLLLLAGGIMILVSGGKELWRIDDSGVVVVVARWRVGGLGGGRVGGVGVEVGHG